MKGHTRAYSQKESLSSLDFDGSNSIHEDEGGLVNSFFSFNCLFESQMIYHKGIIFSSRSNVSQRIQIISRFSFI